MGGGGFSGRSSRSPFIIPIRCQRERVGKPCLSCDTRPVRSVHASSASETRWHFLTERRIQTPIATLRKKVLSPDARNATPGEAADVRWGG